MVIIVGGRAQGPFMHVGLADDHGTRLAQTVRGSGIIVRRAEFSHAVGGGHAGQIDIILQGDGDAVHGR